MDVFAHPWLGGLFGDAEMAALWSAEAQLGHMLAFEAAWSRAGALAGLWPAEAGEAAARAIEGARIAPADLSRGMGRDGVPVPALVRRLREIAGEAVHTGATSQDVVDSATAMSLRHSLDLLDARLAALDADLRDLARRHGATEITGRTRMQAALPIAAATRIAAWRLPLADHRARLAAVAPRVAAVQVGGPAGDRARLGEAHQAVADAVADALGLHRAPAAWHARRDGIGEVGAAFSLIAGSLGKMGQDVALMAQGGEIRLSGGGGSSAMPHKQNPVGAELLVTLGRFAAAQVGGLHQALVHEQERSGAAWALEWMLLPPLAMAAARSLAAGRAVAAEIEGFGPAA